MHFSITILLYVCVCFLKLEIFAIFLRRHFNFFKLKTSQLITNFMFNFFLSFHISNKIIFELENEFLWTINKLEKINSPYSRVNAYFFLILNLIRKFTIIIFIFGCCFIFIVKLQFFLFLNFIVSLDTHESVKHSLIRLF